MLTSLRKDLNKLANKEKAEAVSGYFKTGKGEYGEGDVFLGVTMPELRVIAKKYENLSIKEIQTLLKSKIHEHRMTALVIVTLQYKTADEKKKKQLYTFYLKNTKYINNWDLVDVTAPNIVGEYLLDKKKRAVLYKLARSTNLWEKRIAIISTLTFIKNKSYKETLKLAEVLLYDTHDLMHKAVGWMLREIGKRDQRLEESFLFRHHKFMPRTTLRYAIERFSEQKRNHYMGK